MSREVRRVPEDWQHPRGKDGNYLPLYDQDFKTAAAEWKAAFQKWEADPQDSDYEFWEYEGDPPDREYYRPEWTDESRTHYQMYQTTSEGTPISPVMETPDELARWLANTGASSFADMTATYEQWLAVCKGGYAPSMVFDERKGLRSGVEAMKEL